ncbi:MAG: hypothetical protein GF308_21880 [Candidatus Heimdallarchaeota archaeon]|nr:hypothetical protein [Candidatus Heimdallarchaeota archaeon]
MIETEEEVMTKERRSSEDIINILAEVITTEEQPVGRIARKTEEQGNYVKDETIERHIKLIQQVQELFAGKKVHYQEQEIAGRTYKTAWIEEKE